MNFAPFLVIQLAAIKVQSEGISRQQAIIEALDEVVPILTLGDLERRGLFGILSTAIH